MDRLAANLDDVRRRIDAACRRVGRTNDVTLVVVTKGVPRGTVERLPALGVTVVGENRVQEAREKHTPALRWHLIGTLQGNKARQAAGIFEAIHSIDRFEIAERLADCGRPIDVFVQVNVSGEPTKHGFAPAEAVAAVERIRARCSPLRAAGLMTMAPPAQDPERARPFFRRLRELARECGAAGLSMGMSRDFEAAVEEGATHVRIGTAIFEGVAPLR